MEEGSVPVYVGVAGLSSDFEQRPRDPQVQVAYTKLTECLYVLIT